MNSPMHIGHVSVIVVTDAGFARLRHEFNFCFEVIRVATYHVRHLDI